MHCVTSSRPVFDLSRHADPRVLPNEIVRFVRGLRGPRQAHVTRREIGRWLVRTPEAALDAALADLLAAGRIKTVTTDRSGQQRVIGYILPTSAT